MSLTPQRKRMIVFGGAGILVVVLYVFLRHGSSAAAPAAATSPTATWDPSTGQYVDANGLPITNVTGPGGAIGGDSTVPTFTDQPSSSATGDAPASMPVPFFNVTVQMPPTSSAPAPPSPTDTTPVPLPPTPQPALTTNQVLAAAGVKSPATLDPAIKTALLAHMNAQTVSTFSTSTVAPPLPAPEHSPVEHTEPLPATTASVPIETRPHVATGKAIAV